MRIIRTHSGKEVKIFAETFENEAYDQIKRLANYPAYENSIIRIMPDSHAGKGCTVGTTMTITDKVTPNLVGVDIGCGMLTVELADQYIDCEKLDSVIREMVPNGFNIHDTQKANFDFSNLRCAKQVDLNRAYLSLGTLGGGNHLLRWTIQKETIGTIWLFTLAVESWEAMFVSTIKIWLQIQKVIGRLKYAILLPD